MVILDIKGVGGGEYKCRVYDTLPDICTADQDTNDFFVWQIMIKYMNYIIVFREL